MAADPGRLAVLPSEIDANLKCVLVENEKPRCATARPVEHHGPRLRPDGYGTRRVCHGDLWFRGKRVPASDAPTLASARPNLRNRA